MRYLRRIECFLAVAEQLHFRRAADHLNMTQPALSQQIAALEEELDIELFERDRRSVRLTEAGAVLKPAAYEAIQSLQKAMIEIDELSDKKSQTVRFAYAEYVNPPFLPAVIRALSSRRRSIEIAPLPMASDAVAQAVADKQADLGLSPMPLEHPDLATRVVMKGHWCILVPRDHPLAKLDEVNAVDLASYPLILFARSLNPSLYDILTAQIGRGGESPHVVMTVTQASNGPRLVQEGIGAFLYASYVLDAIPNDLVTLPISDLGKMQFALVWRGDGRSAAVKAFLAAQAEL